MDRVIPVYPLTSLRGYNNHLHLVKLLQEYHFPTNHERHSVAVKVLKFYSMVEKKTKNNFWIYDYLYNIIFSVNRKLKETKRINIQFIVLSCSLFLFMYLFQVQLTLLRIVLHVFWQNKIYLL